MVVSKDNSNKFSEKKYKFDKLVITYPEDLILKNNFWVNLFIYHLEGMASWTNEPVLKDVTLEMLLTVLFMAPVFFVDCPCVPMLPAVFLASTILKTISSSSFL